jgi:hypothetical protein
MSADTAKIGRTSNRGSKPGERRGGRKKGTPNKLTGDVKAMILAALDEAGGKDYLVRQAEEEPKAFMALLGRVLPMQVAGDPDNPLQSAVTISFVRTDAARPDTAS